MTMMLMNNKCWWWWQYDDGKVGSSLTLPCNTTNLGDLVLLWRQARKHNFHYIHDYWKASSSLWSSKRIIFGPILQLYISSLNFLVHSSFVNFLLQLFISHFNFHPPIFQFILHLVISHPTPVLHFISYFHFIFPFHISISYFHVFNFPFHLCQFQGSRIIFAGDIKVKRSHYFHNCHRHRHHRHRHHRHIMLKSPSLKGASGPTVQQAWPQFEDWEGRTQRQRRIHLWGKYHPHHYHHWAQKQLALIIIMAYEGGAQWSQFVNCVQYCCNCVHWDSMRWNPMQSFEGFGQFIVNSSVSDSAQIIDWHQYKQKYKDWLKPQIQLFGTSGGNEGQKSPKVYCAQVSLKMMINDPHRLFLRNLMIRRINSIGMMMMILVLLSPCK